MAGIDFSQPLLGAGASAKTDFAAAQARAGLDFSGQARFKRGVKAALGLKAFVDASAGLSKFIHASIEGTAFARAQAGIQLQLPLNLFDEFGFSARAEAIAEAAAGVKVALGLSIGDFVMLAKRDANLTGLPLEILLLFLEEVSIGGEFEINVAASAKAHASLSVSGAIIERAGDPAGFFYTLDAGAGLAAGVGMGLKAGAEFKDFRRFYGRTVDKTVDAAIQEILQRIPPDLKLVANGDALAPWFQAFAPVAKIALRIAYELGRKITENNPGHSKNDAAALCNETIKTFLEEAQRYIIHKLLECGIDSIRKLLEQEVPNLPLGKWDDPAVVQCRTALATQLLAMPAEPFQDTQENMDYWRILVQKSINLVIALNDPDPKLTEAISIIYCTAELLMEAIRAKINSASAYAMVIGAGSVKADTQPFKGSLHTQPDPRIATAIRNVIGGSGALSYADLLQFLIDDLLIQNVLAAFPELNRFAGIFKTDFAKTENEILKLLLQHTNTFNLANPHATQADPHALLSLIVTSIDRFLTEKFRSDILPQILQHVSDPNLKLYIEEVLFAAVVYTKDVGLHTILNWENEPVDKEDLTEALAGVMMLLLGRTVVIIADTLLTAAQLQVKKTGSVVADQIRTLADNSAANLPAIKKILPHTDPDLIRLVADCVEVGTAVLGPLPDDTRTRVRRLLYQIFEVLPPGKEKDFLTSLGDEFFIPNVDQLHQLANELTEISKDRFIIFVEQFILKVGDYVLAKLEELILAAIALILNWEKRLAEALLAVTKILRELEAHIVLLNQQAIELMSAANDALHRLFQELGSPALRNTLKHDLTHRFTDKALIALEDNALYKTLPADWRKDIKDMVNGTVSAAIDNPFTQPIFEAIAAISGQLDALLPDIKSLDPEDNLPEQMMLLMLDKLEENIRKHYGSARPQLSLVIKYDYWTWVIDSPLPPFGRWEKKHIAIPLGRIEINLSLFINLIRNAILSMNFYHDALNDAGFKLANALAKELELAASRQLLADKTKEKQRLETINGEHNVQPREIAVLSPLPLSQFTRTIDCKIHLGGVPMSYLGLGKDEMQRVLIFINGTLIPPKSLLIDKSPLDATTKDHLKDIDYGHLFPLDDTGEAAINLFDPASGIINSAKTGIIANTALRYPMQALNRQQAASGNRYVFSNAARQEQISGKTMYQRAPAVSEPVQPRLTRSSATIGKGKNKGKMVHSYDISNSFPGRNIPSAGLNNLMESLLPGVFIQFPIPLDAGFIVEGINVLTVVVIERNGHRHQQNVSFTVSHEPDLQTPAPGVIRINDPRSGKTDAATMTLANLIAYFNDKNNKDDQNKEKPHNYLAWAKKGKIKKQPLKKTALVSGKLPAGARVIKKEKIAVMQRKKDGSEVQTGKSAAITYASTAERKARLDALKLNNSTLVAKGRRLKTLEVSYTRSTASGSAPDKKQPVAKLNPIGRLDEKIFRQRIQSSKTYLEKQAGLNFMKK